MCVECFPYILLLCFFAEGQVLIKDNDNVVRLNLEAKFSNISVLWFTFPFLDVSKKKNSFASRLPGISFFSSQM